LEGERKPVTVLFADLRNPENEDRYVQGNPRSRDVRAAAATPRE